jgi:spore coat polysaccharide biosynthesis protein SpsF
MSGPAAAGKPGAIILARMDSARLPGKVLADLGGRPVLDHVRSRLPAESLSAVVLATSDRAIDDPLADYAASRGIGLYRGSAGNVAGRFVAAAGAHGLGAAFRVNGDSPFLEPRLFREAAALFHLRGGDLTTNLSPRTYAYGVSVELVRVAALEAALLETDDPEDREHVTRVLYRTLPAGRIVSLAPGPYAPNNVSAGPRLAIDTQDDLDTARRLASLHGGRFDGLGHADALASGLYAPANREPS